MAEKKHWAWSPIVSGDKTVPFGESVSKTSLGVDQDNWDALVEAGSVRDYEPPKMPAGYSSSPVAFLQEQAAKAQDNEELALSASLGGSYFGPSAEEVLTTGAGKVEEK